MNKIIIGLVGEMAAGKTTATTYLKEGYGAVSFRFSDALRDTLVRLHIPQEREHMQKLSTMLRHTFGEDILSQVLLHDVQASDADVVITEGIRRPSDVTFLKQLPNFFMVALHADERTRYERITKRNENPDDTRKTWDVFREEGKREAETEIQHIAKQADFHINNNGSLEETHKQLNTIMGEIQSK